MPKLSAYNVSINSVTIDNSEVLQMLPGFVNEDKNKVQTYVNYIGINF